MIETKSVSRLSVASAQTLTRGNALVRTSEWIAIGYFCYSFALCITRGLSSERVATAATVPILIWMLAQWEANHSRPWTRVCRALFMTALILAAYWQLDWFTGTPMEPLQRTWIGWDRQILDQWGLHRMIEVFGPAGPWLLDTCYLLLYAIPPVTILVLFATGRGNRVDQFLTTLLMGTFAAYALLPHFPSIAPRVVFPGDLLPGYLTPVRMLNLYVLDHMDISTSVFPSGHVAVAFSSAFGLWRALPEARWAVAGLASYAVLVFMATVYGRYHYASDGLASIALSVGAWRFSRR